LNNLHRELAPISAAAWDDLEAEIRRTVTRNLAGRRLVDVPEPGGVALAAVTTGHLDPIDAPAEGVAAHVRRARPLVELRVPFTVDRRDVDDVERGAKDPDWQPAKDAARLIARAEDRAIFEGYAAAGIEGLRAASANPAIALPDEPREYPNAVARAVTALRLAGVDGPYSLALSADAYTAVNETSDHGYPIHEHLARLVSGDIVWAPAITGAFLLSTRGGDFELRVGQDLSVGYESHDATSVRLYLQETFTFLTYTAEAVVALG
jgi:uncharacterized linocin/CFP29 family protein